MVRDLPGSRSSPNPQRQEGGQSRNQNWRRRAFRLPGFKYSWNGDLELARVRSIISPRTVLLEYVNAGGGRRTIERSIRQLSLILGVEELGLGPKLA